MVEQSNLSDDIMVITDRGYESYQVFANSEEKS